MQLLLHYSIILGLVDFAPLDHFSKGNMGGASPYLSSLAHRLRGTYMPQDGPEMAEGIPTPTSQTYSVLSSLYGNVCEETLSISHNYR